MRGRRTQRAYVLSRCKQDATSMRALSMGVETFMAFALEQTRLFLFCFRTFVYSFYVDLSLAFVIVLVW